MGMVEIGSPCCDHRGQHLYRLQQTPHGESRTAKAVHEEARGGGREEPWWVIYRGEIEWAVAPSSWIWSALLVEPSFFRPRRGGVGVTRGWIGPLIFVVPAGGGNGVSTSVSPFPRKSFE